MRTRAKQKLVAKATALGARVPRAELFVLDDAITPGAGVSVTVRPAGPSRYPRKETIRKAVGAFCSCTTAFLRTC